MPEKKQNPAAPNIPVIIHAQYVKDFSFENPHSPSSLMPNQDQPKVNVDISTEVRRLPASDEDKNGVMYESSLIIEVKATRKEETIFIVELNYCIVMTVGIDIPKEHHQPLVMIEGPKLAFPFARQIIADAVQQGGFPSVLLNPVNFEALYQQSIAKQKEMEKKEA